MPTIGSTHLQPSQSLQWGWTELRSLYQQEMLCWGVDTYHFYSPKHGSIILCTRKKSYTWHSNFSSIHKEVLSFGLLSGADLAKPVKLCGLLPLDVLHLLLYNGRQFAFRLITLGIWFSMYQATVISTWCQSHQSIPWNWQGKEIGLAVLIVSGINN